MGLIVHRSIERIVKIIVSSEEKISTDDETFVRAMRAVGGYSAVIATEISRIKKELEVNPRLTLRATDLEDRLTLQSESLRETIQLFISNLEIAKIAIKEKTAAIGDRHGAIGNGHYSEIELVSDELGWHGKVDYLKLSNDGCEIVDFKTGEEKPEHEFQMRIYELLWHFDTIRNPNSLPLKEAVLVYPNKRVNISPLSTSEIKDFARILSTRTSVALTEIARDEPVAKPSVTNCCFCSVRQMCSTYWDQSVQDQLYSQQERQTGARSESNVDLEVRLMASNGPRVWRGIVISGVVVLPNTEILVHFGNLAGRWSTLLREGTRVRLQNIFLIQQQNDEEIAIPAVGLKSSSELFVVPE